MKSITRAGPRIAAAAFSCAALLLPGVAQAAARPAATAVRPVITVYVVSQISDTVTPISGATNWPGRAIKLPPGSYPTFTAITPDGKRGYVLSSTGNPLLGYITPVNTATSKALPAIQIASSPGDMAFTPDGKTGYITGGSDVVPLSTATNKLGKPIKVSSATIDIAITPGGKTAYVSDSTTNRVVP